MEFKTYTNEFVPPDHPKVITRAIFQNEFYGGTEDKPRVYFIWGVDELDNKDVALWDSKDVGTAVMDMNFDPIEKETFGRLQ